MTTSAVHDRPKTGKNDQLQDDCKSSMVFEPSHFDLDFRLLEKDSSTYLARWNKVQQERLEHILTDLERQEERTLREAHLQMCDVAKDRHELRREIALNIQRRVNSQGKLLPMTSASQRKQTSRKTIGISDINDIVANGKGVGPCVNIVYNPQVNNSTVTENKTDVVIESEPSKTEQITKEDISTVSEKGSKESHKTKQDKLKSSTVDYSKRQEKEPKENANTKPARQRTAHAFIDYKRQEELSRLKKNTANTQRKWDSGTEHSKSLDRNGMPLIPTSSFKKKTVEKKPTQSVFDRLSKSSKMNSMTSDDFFRSVKTQAARKPLGKYAVTPSLGDRQDRNLLVVSSRAPRTRSVSPGPGPRKSALFRRRLSSQFPA